MLASGRGTNLQAIIDACEKKIINAEVAIVLSDNEKAFALERARKHGIEAVYVEAKDKRKHEENMHELLVKHDVELVVGCLLYTSDAADE